MRRLGHLLLPFLACLAAAAGDPRAGGSCASFLLSKGGTVLVGHNLDESMPVPGLLVVNPRGMARRSLSYDELRSGPGTPRMTWTARYGSVTGTNFGKEFPDGGLNEAGLYVGEQTLLGSEYPKDPGLVKMYHHTWMQYLLDQFATVPEVLESLGKVVPDGHCQWQFFVADREGRSAVIAFEEGKTLVYTGATLPVPVVTNFTYASCLKRLATFEGFGGSERLDFQAGCQPDRRFMWAAAMIQEARRAEAEPTVDQAFAILQQLWCTANRWSLVFDLQRRRVHVTTEKARKVRWLDLGTLDFSCGPPRAIEIDRPLEGDLGPHLVPWTEALNAKVVEAFFAGVDAGFFGNRFWKKPLVKALLAHAPTVRCAPEPTPR